MKADMKVKLNESEFRQIIQEELIRETARQKLLKEGYEPEVVEEILRLDEFGMRDLKALFKWAGGSAEKAKAAIAKGVGDLGAAAKERAEDILDTMAQAGAEAGAVAAGVGKKVTTAFQENYKKSFAEDIDRVFAGIERKYFNDKVLKKAGYDESDMEVIRGKIQELRNDFADFFQF